MKGVKEQEESDKCTFKPRISERPSLDSTNIWVNSSTNSQAVGKFIQRQQVARAKKEESKIYSEYIRKGGSAWENSYSWKAYRQR